MAIFGFKSKKVAEKHQFQFRIPWFDAFDPRLPETSVPLAVGVTVTYSIEDMSTFLKINKMKVYDETFNDKLKSGITKYVKSAVSNVSSDIQIPLIHIGQKITEVSDYVQSIVILQLENVYCVKICALDITSIDINKNSRGFLELNALTAEIEKERMMEQHYAQMRSINMQKEIQMAQHKAQLENFNLQNSLQQNLLKEQSALNLAAMKRQYEMQLGEQEHMQQMQLEMQQMQMKMQLNNQSETMRIQREEMQRAARLQTESTFLEAHKTNLNASTINNAVNNGYNPYEQTQQMGMGGMQQSMKGDTQPQVSYLLAVNGQQVGPFGWAQLQQLAQHGQITQQTFVWTQGMTNWTPAGQVAELAPLFQCVAPAITGMPQMI